MTTEAIGMPAREQVPRRRRAAPAPRPHGTDSASTAPPAPPLGARRASGANNLHLCIQKLQAQRPGTRWHGSCFGGGVLSVASHRLVAAATLAASTACVAACGRDQPLTFAPAPSASASGPVVIHDPPKLTSIETGQLDSRGRELRVACTTCHGVRDAGAPFPEHAADLREFHNGLVVDHGALGCQSCHVAFGGSEPRLRLADGTTVATRDAMSLPERPRRRKAGSSSGRTRSGASPTASITSTSCPAWRAAAATYPRPTGGQTMVLYM